MNYFITGGTGFIGTHLTKLLKEVHPEANIYNLDIVEPGTPLPAVKGHYRSPLKEGETLLTRISVERKMYARLLKSMVSRKWCSRVPSLLTVRLRH